MVNTRNMGIGNIVWWSIPDEISVKRSEWAARFPELPLLGESAGDPLRRALFAIKAPAGTRRLIRPLRQLGQWAIVIETPETANLHYTVDMIVAIENGKLVIIKTTSYSEWMYELGANYERELDKVHNGALADAVLNEVRGRCLAVTARKTGGVYFVPSIYADKIDKITNVLQAIGGNLYSYAVGADEHSRQQVLTHIVDDMKTSVDTVTGLIEGRHKTDAVNEGKQALDRIRYYRDAFNLLTDESNKIEAQLNDLIVKALTKKDTGEK